MKNLESSTKNASARRAFFLHQELLGKKSRAAAMLALDGDKLAQGGDMGKLKGLVHRKLAWGLVSVLALVEQAHAARLEWDHDCASVALTKEYVVESKSSLSDAWTNIGTVPATACASGETTKTFSMPITLTGSAGFYRVGAVPLDGSSASASSGDESSSGSGSSSDSGSGSGSEIPSTVVDD